MNLTRFEELIDDYDGDIGVDPTYLKQILADDIGSIDWSEFLTLQAINIHSPEKLIPTKFLNFSEVASPEAKCNIPIFKDCIVTTQQFANGTFSQFISNDVSWGFCFFLLSYLQDLKVNYSKEDIIEIRKSHDEIHDILVQSIKDCDENAMVALSFLNSIDPKLAEDFMEELM